MTHEIKVDPASSLATFIRERVQEKNELRQAIRDGNCTIYQKKGIKIVNPLRSTRKS